MENYKLFDELQANVDSVWRVTHLPNTHDIKEALKKEGQRHRFRKSGHELPNQGKEYVELRNVTFICDKSTIIDAPEYDELKDGQWYVNNYEPRVLWQLEECLNKLTQDLDSRQAIIQMYDPDTDLKDVHMICTMFIHLRIDKPFADGPLYMEYSVHMRSNDVREFRSDYKWHSLLLRRICNELSRRTGEQVVSKPIIWNACSMQCWDKDWKFLVE